MFRTVVVGLAAASVLAVAGSSGAATLVAISQGHVDAVDVAFEGGKFALTVHDESVEPDVERKHEYVTFVAKRNAAVAIPNNPDYAFLGKPGKKVWVLPEVQDETLLWPGLSTEELPGGVFVNDTVSIRFKRFIGPDGVSLFTTGSDGRPQIMVDSEDKVADVVPLVAGNHKHENWAFEKPGIYLITIDVTGVLASNNKRVTSSSEVLKFVVQG